jgi:uncharacterized membrane protein YhaH (DUF805 family)
MTAPVQLVFRGEVLAGFRLEDVQRELGPLLRADEARLKALFSGSRTVLKRGLAAAEAQRYVNRLAALGAHVHVEPMASPPAATTPTGGWPTIAPPPEEVRRAAPVVAAPSPAATSAAPPAPPAALAAVAASAAAASAASKELALLPIADPEEVVCPKCGERQSKRLLCQACATNIEMGIAAKLEEEALRRAERQAALEARRQPRRAAREAQTGSPSAWPIGFRFSGRVGRLSSAAANLWLIAAMLVLTTGFLQRPTLPRALLMGTGALAVFFFSMRLTVLRCHDCDRHGWWALFVLVPYVGSLASLLFTFLPGNPEENDYGPPPPRGRWRWLGVALLVLVLCTALLVRAGIRFAERYAEAKGAHADDMVDLGGGTSVGGSSGNGAGLQDALRDYANAPGHKAFAASSRQNYAWVGNAGSVDEAMRNAMTQCEAHRPQYTPNCRVVNINGQPGTN